MADCMISSIRREGGTWVGDALYSIHLHGVGASSVQLKCTQQTVAYFYAYHASRCLDLGLCLVNNHLQDIAVRAIVSALRSSLHLRW